MARVRWVRAGGEGERNALFVNSKLCGWTTGSQVERVRRPGRAQAERAGERGRRLLSRSTQRTAPRDVGAGCRGG